MQVQLGPYKAYLNSGRYSTSARLLSADASITEAECLLSPGEVTTMRDSHWEYRVLIRGVSRDMTARVFTVWFDMLDDRPKEVK